MRKGDFNMFMRLLAESFAKTWQGKVTNAVSSILVPLLVIGCSVGMIYAVIVGIKMMKAEDKNAREENKARLINIAISIVAVAILIGLFYALKNWLETSYADGKGDLGGDLGGMFNDPKSSNVGNPLLNTVSLVKQCASMMFFGC